LGAVIAPDDWGALTLVGEAAREIVAGRVAIGEVVRTRMATRFFSDGTVPGTVLFPLQFSCWNSNNKNRVAFCKTLREEPVFAACFDAWMTSASSDLVPGANSYYNPNLVTPAWAASATLVAQIGNHNFMKAG